MFIEVLNALSNVHKRSLKDLVPRPDLQTNGRKFEGDDDKIADQ